MSAPDSSSATSLSAHELQVRLGQHTVLHSVSMHACGGQVCGVIGPNGAGKSTLLDCLAGLLRPQSGEVSLDTRSVFDMSPRLRAQHIAWIEQVGQIHWPLTVERLILLGRLPQIAAWQTPRDADLEAVQRAMSLTDTEHLGKRSAPSLSGGERARVLMARALAAEPAVLLADEPIASLDPGHQLQTMDTLQQVASKGACVVVVLHDLSLAARYCDHLVLLNEGRVLADGSAEHVLTPAHLEQAYQVEVVTGSDPVPWILPVRRIHAEAGQ